MPTKIDTYRLSRKNDRRSKTSDEDINKMKELYHMGFSQKAIADIFGISQSAVSYAVSEQAKAGLAEYRRRNPSKRRTKDESRNYTKSLREYKKYLMEKEKSNEPSIDN